MPTYLPELICSISFGIACLAFGYRQGLANGMKKRSRLHIIKDSPTVQGRKILT